MTPSGTGTRWLVRLEALRALARRALEPPLPNDTRLKPLKSAFLRLLRISSREQGDLNRALIDALEQERLELSASVERLEAQVEELRLELRQDRERAEQRHTDLLWRFDSARKELFYELRYRLDELERLPAQPEVVERESYRAKVAKMTDGVWVNLGSGTKTGNANYVNVDARLLEGVDLKADVRRLPFAEGEVAMLYSEHLIEHFTEWEMRNRILPAWMRILKPGGRLRIICPDAEAMIREYAAGQFDFSALREVTFGSQEYVGNDHLNMFTPDSLGRLLVAAGLTDLTWHARGRRNGQCLEMDVEARKPGG